jgi:glutamate--cysteine ligase
MLLQMKKHQAHFSEHDLSDAVCTRLKHETTESFRQQQQLEANDDSSFEDFLYRQSM